MRTVLIIALSTQIAQADPVTIADVVAQKSNNGTWDFAVTLQHPDTGWEHYADAWRVLDMQGKVLGTRILAHPHVNEQPFTRNLSKIDIDQTVEKVQIQARCSVDGWTSAAYILSLN